MGSSDNTKVISHWFAMHFMIFFCWTRVVSTINGLFSLDIHHWVAGEVNLIPFLMILRALHEYNLLQIEPIYPSIDCINAVSKIGSPFKSKAFIYLKIFVKVKLLVTQSPLTLCDPMDYSPSSSPVHGTLQTRILEWVVIPFSRGSSQPRDWTQFSHIAGRFFASWATRKVTRKIVKGHIFIISAFHIFKKAEESLRLWKHGKYF